MKITRYFLATLGCLLSSCASTKEHNVQAPQLFYGECNVIELEKITRKLSREKYPHRLQVVKYPFKFKDLGDRLIFYTRYPKTWVGGSPTTEFDKETCELIRIYETE